MSNKKYEVEPLFAEPLFKTKIGHAISDKQIEFIKKTKIVQNKLNHISEDLYLLDRPELKSIKDAIQEALDIYASEVMGITQKLYVTQSWSLISQPEIGMHGHSHSNSIVSGSLYYCEMPMPAAGMVFDRNTAYKQIELVPEPHKNNIYNTPLNSVIPKKDELILFASNLQHFVQINAGKEPRYSIAFNTFVKGSIGNYRDVSELKL
jgi:uncharacterized protein (TIGR02466 family)